MGESATNKIISQTAYAGLTAENISLSKSPTQTDESTFKSSSSAGQRRLRTETQFVPANVQNLSPTAVKDDIAAILVLYGNNPFKIPAISYATYLGDEDAVKLLLDNGANVNQASEMGTPLEIALKGQNLKLASFLIEHNAEATAQAASICGQYHFFNELQELIKINPQIIKSEAVVMACCESAFLEGLEFMFNKGATIPKNFTANKVLYFLLYRGGAKYIPIVKFMIKQGADCHYTVHTVHTINKGDKTEWPAYCKIGLITLAIDFDDEEFISLLIKNKAYLNTKIENPHDNRTPNIFSSNFIDNEQRKQIVCLDPLYKAVLNGKFNFANLLIASGAKRDPWLDFQFNIAVSKDSSIMALPNNDYFAKLKKFYELGFLKQEHYFRDTMNWAIKEKSDVRWVRFLFELGAQSSDDYLKWAIEKQNKDIIKCLIEHGAHP